MKKNLLKLMPIASVLCFLLFVCLLLFWNNKTVVKADGARTGIKYLVNTSFDDGIAGEKYFIAKDSHFWDENYDNGYIVNQSDGGFDDKTYKFTGKTDPYGYCFFGGVKLTEAAIGKSYTISLKIRYANFERLFVEYVASNMYGAITIENNQSIKIVPGGDNITATYNSVTHLLTANVTASEQSWSATNKEPGFLKFTAQDSANKNNCLLFIDDVKIREADCVFFNDFESYSSGELDFQNLPCNIWGDRSVVSIKGTSDKYVEFALTDNTSEYSIVGYVNRLGMLQNGKQYKVSFDYELIGAEKFYVEYAFDGGAGLSIDKNGQITKVWGDENNLNNYKVVLDSENSRKGTVSFDFNMYSGTEFKLTTQNPDTAGNNALIIDNFLMDSERKTLSIEVDGNDGIVLADTFYPVSGEDCMIYVEEINGYKVSSFKIDGVEKELSLNNIYTISEISDNHTISVIFEKKTVELNVNKTSGIIITFDKDEVILGDNVEITLTIEEDYSLVAVRINGQKVSFTDGKYIINNVQSDINITAIAQYTGSGEPSVDPPVDIPDNPPENPSDNGTPSTDIGDGGTSSENNPVQQEEKKGCSSSVNMAEGILLLPLFVVIGIYLITKRKERKDEK